MASGKRGYVDPASPPNTPGSGAGLAAARAAARGGRRRRRRAIDEAGIARARAGMDPWPGPEPERRSGFAPSRAGMRPSFRHETLTAPPRGTVALMPHEMTAVLTCAVGYWSAPCGMLWIALPSRNPVAAGKSGISSYGLDFGLARRA